MNFKQDLKKVMILYPDVLVKSSEEYRDLVNLHNIVEATFGNDVDLGLVKSAFENKESFPSLKSANDYYYLIFVTAAQNKQLKKFAYPMMHGVEDPGEEFDIEKWANLVYKIYDAVNSGDMDLTSAIDYYADTLDDSKGEDDSFKHWIKYYQNGEHLKYSEGENDLEKVGFQFPISGPGFYGPENAPVIKERFEESKSKANKTNDYQEWRGKLYSAIRRIDKLLRQSDDFVSIDDQRELADLLHQFDQEVRSLRLESTASDLAFKYANKFKKLGFTQGYNEFSKYAQELEPETLDPALENREDVPEPPQDDLGEPAGRQPSMDDDSIERSLEGAPGAKAGEYEALAGEVDLGTAVRKLEEIAGRLSDRRTIRLLAEFDIMLDKIGIAPMFPELAEAQSKLIDGYSYALTRVTKMLGMLSSGKSLVEISDAKKREISDKTMKEVDKTMNPPEEPGERGAPAIQQGLEESVEPAAPEPAPEAPTEVPEV